MEVHYTSQRFVLEAKRQVPFWIVYAENNLIRCAFFVAKCITLHKQCTFSPQGNHLSKMAWYKMILEFNFRRGLFCSKMPKSKSFI
jgi:hypothetical protein